MNTHTHSIESFIGLLKMIIILSLRQLLYSWLEINSAVLQCNLKHSDCRFVSTLWPRVITTSHFRNDALHRIIVPEISLGTLHPIGHVSNARKVFFATVLAAIETSSSTAIRNLFDRLSYDHCSSCWCVCGGSFCDSLRDRAGGVWNIIISFSNARNFLRVVALVV